MIHQLEPFSVQAKIFFSAQNLNFFFWGGGGWSLSIIGVSFGPFIHKVCCGLNVVWSLLVSL